MKENQRLKMLYLKQLFEEQTDEEHALTMPDILKYLEENEISAERKMIYQDIAELRRFGMDIISEKKGRETCYYLGSRSFETAELKLIIDSVQAAKFISARKSQRLIKKLTALMSRPEAKELSRQVLLSGRVKTMNESVYYSVDLLHSAIGRDRQIRFQYTQWDLSKKLVPRHNGQFYQVSPWYLIWDDENYYLVAYDTLDEKIKHFRLDKMIRLSVIEERRIGKEALRQYDASGYSKQHFGMFGGEKRRVILRCKNSFAGIIIDRFGREVDLYPSGEDHFEAHVDVVISDQFYGCVMSLGEGIRIEAPQSVAREFDEKLQRIHEQYQEAELGGQSFVPSASSNTGERNGKFA
ncbi:MAG: WYL domain-containing protein [Firmicutes bacterium]|nr:WYL domain-containing protein [Bacillota bacterium]